MSLSFNCKCQERKVSDPAQRAWHVVQRNENRSAFNGYRPTFSQYSTVQCKHCRAIGRTKASFVTKLPNAPEDWYKL